MTAKQFVEMVARMKTEKEFGKDAPPTEDWISTVNGLVELAREVRGRAKKDKKKATALAACKALVDAYDLGELRGGSMDWADVDTARELALTALGKEKK